MSAPGEHETPPTESTVASSSSAPQYEFDGPQNALIGDLGSKMQFVGMFVIVIGVLVLLGGVLVANVRSLNPGAFIAGILYIAIGAWTRSAGTSFREVVATRGADISHLMEALTDVRRICTLFYWISIIAIALLVITLILAALYPPELVPVAAAPVS